MAYQKRFIGGFTAFGLAVFSITSMIIGGGGIAALTLVQHASAQAISESHIAAAKKMIKATRSSDSFDNILPNLAQSAKQSLIRNLPDKETEISGLVDEVALELAPRRADLENELARIMASAFTEDELLKIAEFYSTPAGQKFIETSPLAARESIRASRVWAGGIERDMSAKIGEKMKAAGLQ